MAEFFHEHAQWLATALVAIAAVLFLTIYSFWKKRYADRGPKKGEPKYPQRVRQQNPQDRHN